MKEHDTFARVLAVCSLIVAVTSAAATAMNAYHSTLAKANIQVGVGEHLLLNARPRIGLLNWQVGVVRSARVRSQGAGRAPGVARWGRGATKDLVELFLKLLLAQSWPEF